MANQEHLEVLHQGVQAWNQWREQHPNTLPELNGANLAIIDLSDADMGHTDLRDANLWRATLNSADFSYADLSGADLSYAELRNTYFIMTQLTNADFSHADLSEADLRSAYLTGTYFNGADLTNVNFTYARAWGTTFGEVDLSVVRGLETVDHDGPSTIGIDTIYRSKGTIPEAFLRGAGVDDTFITYIHSLVG